MTADFRINSHKRNNRRFLSNMFTVEVVDFDGESREYSVSAESFEDAAREAENLAFHDCIQISFMNINAY